MPKYAVHPRMKGYEEYALAVFPFAMIAVLVPSVLCGSHLAAAHGGAPLRGKLM